MNGVHSDSRRQQSPYTNGHSQSDSMNPYQQHHPGGYGAPHQRHYPNAQLPPMNPNMNYSSMQPPQGGPSQAGPSTAQPAVYQPPSRSSTQLSANGPSERVLFMAGNNGQYKFELKVEQQPMRARMCGFGDKDRRPITPPPCIRLIITDLHTGQPAPMDDVDGSFFVLNVDLWDEEASREVNVVRSSSSSPAVSISTATTTSYPPPPDHPMIREYQVYTGPDGQPIYTHPHYAQPMGPAPGGYPPQVHYYNHGGVTVAQPVHPMHAHGIPPPSPNSSMFTRNLIGSNSVNASVLKDLDGELGFFFVLQDLSVRTEGFFRLKLGFVDLRAPDGSGLNRGKAPVLAFAFSEKFQVYSAKKFPGVIESTDLSKCFAQQGIKIPIRKDGKGGGGDDDDE